MRVVLVAAVLASACKAGFEHGPDAPPPPPACQPGMFVADFQTVPPWAAPYQSGDSTVMVANGEVHVDLGTQVSDSAAGIFSQTFAFAEMRVEVASTLALVSGRAYMCMTDCNLPEQELMYVENGTIKVLASSQGGELAHRTYNPVGDRFWRAREHLGMMSWETSADGETWFTLVSYATPPAVQSAQLWLGAWNERTANAGTARYSRFQSCVEL